MTKMNFGLLVGTALWAAASWFAAPVGAEERLTVIVDEATVHELPGSGQPVVMRIERCQRLYGGFRVGPGRQEIGGLFGPTIAVDVPTGEEWVDVGVYRSGGKSGWVRSAHIAPDRYGLEIETEVIDRCLRAGIRASRAKSGAGRPSELEEQLQLEILKGTLHEDLNALSCDIAEVVSGKTSAERDLIYEQSLGMCIVAILGDD